MTAPKHYPGIRVAIPSDEYIARAVNAHEDMVAALSSILELLENKRSVEPDDMPFDGPTGSPPIIEVIRAAHVKAEGK